MIRIIYFDHFGSFTSSKISSNFEQFSNDRKIKYDSVKDENTKGRKRACILTWKPRSLLYLYQYIMIRGTLCNFDRNCWNHQQVYVMNTR